MKNRPSISCPTEEVPWLVESLVQHINKLNQNLNPVYMKKNSLTPNAGLSLSQAQSISNLCHQRALEIENKLSGINNYSKSVDIASKKETTTHVIVVGKPIPSDVVALLTEKATLHACQGFLMENIKAKEASLNENKRATADISSVVLPERITPKTPEQLPQVNEDFGWSQLSVADLNEFIEADAFAAHIGQFIHKEGTLNALRKELPTVAPIEWMTIKDGEKSPVKVVTHHTSDQLLKVHEELAGLHREREQRVNYFKAKVKNLTTEENARIAKVNADAQHDAQKFNNDQQAAYETAFKAVQEQIRTIQAEFEKERQSKVKDIAAMRINVDARFKKVINQFMGQLSDKQE